MYWAWEAANDTASRVCIFVRHVRYWSWTLVLDSLSAIALVIVTARVLYINGTKER